MTSLNYTTLINQLEHCGFTKITRADVINEGRECGLLVIAEGDFNRRFNSGISFLKFTYQEARASLFRELRSHLDGPIDYIAVTNSGDTYRVEIYFRFVSFPADYERNSKCNTTSDSPSYKSIL
jgi:hypothetical protein